MNDVILPDMVDKELKAKLALFFVCVKLMLILGLAVPIAMHKRQDGNEIWTCIRSKMKQGKHATHASPSSPAR